MRKAKAVYGVLTCPICGHKQKQKIPVGKCEPFYRCKKCKNIIQAKKTCCVFCDYADRKCPVGHKAVI